MRTLRLFFMLLTEVFVLFALLVIVFQAVYQPENVDLADIVKAIVFGAFYIAMQFDDEK